MQFVLFFASLPACQRPPAASDPDPPADSTAQGDSSEVIDDPGNGDPALLCTAALICLGNVLDEPKGPCDLDVVSGDGVHLYHGPAGVELRGRSSLAFPKPQYGVELRKHTELPVWPGFIWHYLDDGTDPGTDWKNLTFDDSGWRQGAAPLGYGETWLGTTVNAGPDPLHVFPAVYYRYVFSPANLNEITDLAMGIIRNDASAVYLNGTEVLRENLPTDAGYQTLADAPITTADEFAWLTTALSPALLVDGPNILGVEIHQASADSPDSRFDLYLDAAGPAVDVNLFDTGSESDWVLNGLYADRVLFRNKLAFDLFQSFGSMERYAPESMFCELTLNGAYEGIYSLGESIKRSPERVSLAKADSPGQSFIIKLDDELGFHANRVGYGTWQMVYPEGDEAEASVSAFLTGWEDAVLDTDDKDGEMWTFIDMDSAVDWVILQELTKNVDAYQLSVYLWRDVGGKAHFTPWDFDLSMGYPYYDCGAEGWIPRFPYVDAMAADPAFRNALSERWAALRADQLSNSAIRERIAAYDVTLAPALTRNDARWPTRDIAFATDDVDNWLCPVSNYEDEHQRVLDFITDRLDWMDANILNF